MIWGQQTVQFWWLPPRSFSPACLDEPSRAHKNFQKLCSSLIRLELDGLPQFQFGTKVFLLAVGCDWYMCFCSKMVLAHVPPTTHGWKIWRNICLGFQSFPECSISFSWGYNIFIPMMKFLFAEGNFFSLPNEFFCPRLFNAKEYQVTPSDSG